ncbi:MAG TPA: alpha/beta hydrolase [Acidimicrobiales bacterium]|nr:alpha/beta hydrolase [Acidimicrobiales bacterium]
MSSTSPAAAAAADQVPWMPDGAVLDLAGDRRLFVRDSGGPPGAPTLVLLHGWMATADLNYGFSYASLSENFRVIAFDQRGHGRGLRNGARFGFARCADDVVDVLDALGIDRAIAVGYSMGGPVALQFANRHPERAEGLVLCATAGRFSRSPLTRAALAPVGALVGATSLVPDSRLRTAARRRFISRRASGRYAAWISEQLAPSDPTTIAQAGVALGRFDASGWCTTIEVPCASIVTTDDALVHPANQRALARSVPNTTTFEVTGGHTTCFDQPTVFTPVLVDACRSVGG